MSKYSVENSNLIGFCVKTPQGPVLAQSPACQKICGQQTGASCQEACLEKIRSRGGLSPFQTGMQFSANVSLHGQACDVALLQEDDRYVIFFYSRDEKVRSRMDDLASYGLSAREREIAEWKLRGLRKAEIAEKLCISISTLKTHINNIYKKVPRHLLKRV